MDTNRHEYIRLFQLFGTAILAVSLLTGCPAVDFKEFNFTRSLPEEKDLVGIWIPSPETLEEIRDRGHYPTAEHQITVNSDGSIQVINMPDWWKGGFGISNEQLDSFEGSWKLNERDPGFFGHWVIQITTLKFSSSFNLYGQSSPYKIFIRVGDPNSGDAMFFERVQPK